MLLVPFAALGLKENGIAFELKTGPAIVPGPLWLPPNATPATEDCTNQNHPTISYDFPSKGT